MKTVSPNGNSWKSIFWRAGIIFFHFSATPASEGYFLSSGNVFLNDFGGGFSILWRPFFYLIFLIYKWKPSQKLKESNLFEKDFAPVERDYPLSGICPCKWQPLL